MAACRMTDTYNQHIPVLLTEAVDALVHNPNGVYVDATFGRGSHSKAILEKLSPNGRLIAIDRDPDAIRYAKQTIQDDRFTIVHSSFSHLSDVLSELDLLGKVDGVLFDLGVSSPQLDNPARGFSFSRSGKLDMRMDTTQGIDAATWVATTSEADIANALYVYGEEKRSRRIASAIVAARAKAPITTTAELAEIISKAMPKPKGKQIKHPATRSFQAIRIAVNEELRELEVALESLLDVLAVKGRLAAISFHSLEDRIVKRYIRQQEKGDELPRGLPVKGDTFNARLKSVNKAIKPSDVEIQHNPRARSAVLRIAEKLS